MIKTVGIDKDITIADKVKFILSTTDSNGCLKTPYKINKATIYFISREFVETSISEYSKETYDPVSLRSYEKQKEITCSSPTENNLNKLKLLKAQLENSKFKSPFFFKEAIPIKIFGSVSTDQGEVFPAWLNPDLVPLEVKEKVKKDNILYCYEEEKIVQEGKFVLEWDPVGCREGDYFICWNWSPNIAGEDISSHMMFVLGADSRITASIPTHYTRKEKYEVLMEKYLPEMFKNILSESDISPYVLQELNLSVAKGFTFVEDFANQIIDMLDANSIHEQLLPLLSNLFNLKLKSGDPTLWRRQTKKAISNFKRKGTVVALESALSDAGIHFLRINKLWQVISKYTYQEHFEKEDSNTFKLKRNIVLPLDERNFELHIRKKEENFWTKLNSNYVQFQEEYSHYNCIWIGDTLVNPLNLEKGDSIKILYQTADFPDEEVQKIDEYIRLLDLMDQRDERAQKYPIKNWNTRVIEEDDPLFDIIIPIKHPIQDPIIWGKVRTEFPYSENVYNMEEYNGSTRDSRNPCDISKDFVDPCVDCQASSFSVDVEIENLSNDRVLECEKIIKEFIPFHSLIHNINYLGSYNEFIKPPIEDVQILISFLREDVLVSGSAQHIFTRAIAEENQNLVKRNILSQIEDKTGIVSGTGYNQDLFLFSPSFSKKSDLENENFLNKSNGFNNKNIDVSYIEGSPYENSNLLEILSPSANAGIFSISKCSKNSLKIVSKGLNAISEPLNKAQFEFRVSNKIHQQTAEITQDDIIIFNPNFELSDTKIISKKDIENNLAVGVPFRIRMNNSDYFEFEILEILTNNELIINGPKNADEFPINLTNIEWELINTSLPLENQTIRKGENGKVNFIKRGLVNLNIGTPAFDDIRDMLKLGDYVLYEDNQYKIKQFLKENNYKFYIDSYNQGDVGGVNIIIYRRVIENCVGQLDYMGLVLETINNYENELSIQNGKNYSGIVTKSNNLKENYLILIDSNYYSILDIDGSKITLDGPNKDWTTLGTQVNFTIYKFIKQSLEVPESNQPKIPGYKFDQISRSNNEVIEKEENVRTSFLANKILNSINSGSEVFDSFSQIESINFEIEYKEEENE